MKKFTGLLQKKDKKGASNGHTIGRHTSDYVQGSPEDVSVENVRLFCQGGSNNRVSHQQRTGTASSTNAIVPRTKKYSTCRPSSLLLKALLQLPPLLVVR